MEAVLIIEATLKQSKKPVRLRVSRTFIINPIERMKRNGEKFFIGTDEYMIIGQLVRQPGLWLVRKTKPGSPTEKMTEQQILMAVEERSKLLSVVARNGAAHIPRRKHQVC